jgi:hypothetical protein
VEVGDDDGRRIGDGERAVVERDVEHDRRWARRGKNYAAGSRTAPFYLRRPSPGV